jgi:hypothetical protein
MLFTSGTRGHRITDNAILAAFREYPEHTAEAAQLWVDALEDPDGGTEEIHADISDAIWGPDGPGWEDIFWIRSSQIYKHAEAVLKRFVRIYG